MHCFCSNHRGIVNGPSVYFELPRVSNYRESTVCIPRHNSDLSAFSSEFYRNVYSKKCFSVQTNGIKCEGNVRLWIYAHNIITNNKSNKSSGRRNNRYTETRTCLVRQRSLQWRRVVFIYCRRMRYFTICFVFCSRVMIIKRFGRDYRRPSAAKTRSISSHHIAVSRWYKRTVGGRPACDEPSREWRLSVGLRAYGTSSGSRDLSGDSLSLGGWRTRIRSYPSDVQS